jgi:hypothetical protein
MQQVILRYIVITLGLLVVGAICAQASGAMLSPRGALGPTALLAASPISAMLTVLVVFAIGAMIAAVVGRMTNAIVGLFVLGGGLFALTHRLTTVNEVAFSGGSITTMAIETLLWAAVVLVGTIVVFRVARPLPDIEPHEDGTVPNPWTSVDAVKSAACGVIVLPLVWVLAQSTLKGQAVGSVFVAAMVAAMAARLWVPHVQPILIFASPLLFAGIGQVVSGMMMDVAYADALREDAIPALLRVSPLQFTTGTLLGVAIGIGWAKSFLHHEDEHETAPVAHGA